MSKSKAVTLFKKKEFRQKTGNGPLIIIIIAIYIKLRIRTASWISKVKPEA